MTFKPISITDRNVVLCSEPCQSGFIDALNDHQLSWLLWKYVCIKMMLGSLICASKFKSVCNRPSTVHYWEHCLTHRLHSLLHITQTDCTPSCTLQTALPPAFYTHTTPMCTLKADGGFYTQTVHTHKWWHTTGLKRLTDHRSLIHEPCSLPYWTTAVLAPPPGPHGWTQSPHCSWCMAST